MSAGERVAHQAQLAPAKLTIMLSRLLSLLDVRPQFEATQSLTGIGVGRAGAVLHAHRPG
jgi:hypothetical protein